jgi:ParB family chromosome partitioning protein
MYRDSIFWVEVERIKPNPFQPRREFDQGKLQELAESIRMYGLLQPLTVTRNEIPREDGGLMVEYELIAGERRLRASKLAGLAQVPVIIRVGEETDQMKLELAIIENLQREDLNPVDRAKAFEKLYREFKFTHSEIGKKMGKSREYVSNTLRLLLLPEQILGHLAEGKISEGHTRPLLMLNDKPDEQQVLAREILLKKLTVRESEALARRVAQDKVSARHKIDPEILELERALTEKLGTRVTIEPREVGGRVVISFFSADDLQTLLDTIRMEQEATTVFNSLPPLPTPAVDPAAEARAAQAEAEASVTEVDRGVGEQFIDELIALNDAPIDDSTPDTPFSDAGVPVPLEESVAAPHETGVLASTARPVPEVSTNPTQPSTERAGEDEHLYSIRNFTI